MYLLGLTAGQRDLYFIAQTYVAQTYNSSAFTAAALVYLMITIPLTYAVNWLDRRLREGKNVRPVGTDLAAPVELVTPGLADDGSRL